jgi:hypothetical protein
VRGVALTVTVAFGCTGAAADPPVRAEVPAAVPAGWRPLLDWSADCPLWLPPSRDALPAGLRWEPCATDLPDRLSCRQIAVDWEHDGNPAFARSPHFWADRLGRGALFFTRNAIAGRGGPSSYLEWVVTEVDGPVEFAMRMPVDGGWRCVATEQDLNEGRFAIRLRGDGSGPGLGSDADALLVGRIGRLEPELAWRDATASTASWAVGAEWLVRGAAPERELFLHRAADPGRPPVTLSSPDGARPAGSMPRVVGAEVVYERERGGGLMAWDEGRGARALTRGAQDGNLGTDGSHLVWTRDEGGRRSIMAAPFATDPGELRPRRLRSDPSPILGAHDMRFAVGCGFAGRNAMPPRDLLLVRLADGVSWRLAAAPGWSWGQVLGFTCEEAFVTAFSRGQGISIARVRLDSLGRGTPPD